MTDSQINNPLPIRLAIEEVENYASHSSYDRVRQLAGQLADVMREHERLREALDTIRDLSSDAWARNAADEALSNKELEERGAENATGARAALPTKNTDHRPSLVCQCENCLKSLY